MRCQRPNRKCLLSGYPTRPESELTLSVQPTTTVSIKLLLHLLSATIGVLLSLLAGAVATAMSRHDGDSWPTAIRYGGKTFVATITVLAVLYGLAIATT